VLELVCFSLEIEKRVIPGDGGGKRPGSPRMFFVAFNPFGTGEFWVNKTVGMCGGALIDNTTVLSAAHCFVEGETLVIPGDKLKVYAGDFTYMSIDNKTGSRINGAVKTKKVVFPRAYRVASVTIPVGYNATHRMENDIAVIKLRDPVDPSWPIDICQHDFADKALKNYGINITGIGATYYAKINESLSIFENPSSLREVTLSRSEAYEEAAKQYIFVHKNQKMLTGYGGSACYGDSGSPSYPDVPKSEHSGPTCLLGLVSRVTENCTVPHQSRPDEWGFTIITYVPPYLTWIDCVRNHQKSCERLLPL